MCFELIKDKKLKLATAESCTGGLLGSTITDVPGASAYYLGGVISYSNDAKINILGVKKETIERYGAVSEQCAEEMARGVAELFGADIAIATTGIAGPSGGTTQKPVGTVFIAYHISGKTVVEKHMFSGTRVEIKEKIVKEALQRICDLLAEK